MTSPTVLLLLACSAEPPTARAVDLSPALPEALPPVDFDTPLDEAGWESLCAMHGFALYEIQARREATEVDVLCMPGVVEGTDYLREPVPRSWQFTGLSSEGTVGDEPVYPLEIASMSAVVGFDEARPREVVEIWLEKYGELGLVPCEEEEDCREPGLRSSSSSPLQEGYELEHRGEVEGRAVELSVRLSEQYRVEETTVFGGTIVWLTLRASEAP